MWTAHERHFVYVVQSTSDLTGFLPFARQPLTAMPVPLVLNRRAPTPLHRQIYDQWRDGILSGRFAPGARMPSTRELADLLRVSRARP